MESKAADVENLFIAGDLLDLWFGMKPILVREYYPVLRLLRRLSQSGMKIHYLEGNHDFNLNPYVEDALGSEVHQEFEWSFGGRRALMAHGDGLDPGDVKYRILKRIVRSPFFRLLTACLPGSALWRLGLQFSSVSRSYLGRDRPQFEAQKAYARDRVQEGYDVVVLGHAHVPGINPVEADGRKGLYVNVGDWLTNFTYVDVQDGRFTLKTMDGRPLDARVSTKEEVV